MRFGFCLVCAAYLFLSAEAPAQIPFATGKDPSALFLPEPLSLGRRPDPGNLVSVPINLDINLQNSGSWTNDGQGNRLWQLDLRTPAEVAAVALLLDTCILPAGALFSISGEGFTPHRIPGSGRGNERKLLGFFPSRELKLSLWVPAGGTASIHLFRADYAYHPLPESNSDPEKTAGAVNTLGFGAAEKCHQNIVCSEGNKLEKVRNGVCRIYMVLQEGIGFCTGNLMNNTKKDGRPLVLSAFHCQDGYTPMFDFWRFDFNYQSASCANPLTEPLFTAILGARVLAGRLENDFLLYELSGPVPSSFNVFYMGWDRSTTGPSNSRMIHHPKGDLKKVALSSRQAIIFNQEIKWDNNRISPVGHHFQVNYTTGTFEIGSSGCALLNDSLLLTGMLHGGSANCSVSTGYFSRFSMAWEGGGTPATRLKDWLDPLASDSMRIQGLDNPQRGGGSIAGVLYTETNLPIPNAQILLIADDGFSAAIFSDPSGAYAFTGLSLGRSYLLDVVKSGSVANGLSTFDLLQVQKHILSREILKGPYKWLAADVNNSGSISTSDLILIKRALLGMITKFEKVPIWQFVPLENGFKDLSQPLAGLNPSAFVVPELKGSVPDKDFVGFKSGDVNHSATVDE